MDCSLPGSSIHGILQARILEWTAISFSRGSSQPRDQIQVSCIVDRFFTICATREAQKYWSGYLSLLQGIFLTQELNWGLLHCRWILYQLSYQGSPVTIGTNKRKLCNLRQQKLPSDSSGSSGSNIKMRAGLCFLQRFRGGAFLPFPVSGGSRSPWIVVASL